MNQVRWLVVVVVLVGALVALEEWRLGRLRGEVARLRAERDVALAAIPPPPRPEPPGVAPDDALRRTKARRVMERVRESDAVTAVAGRTNGGESAGPAAALRGMMGNPAGRAVMRSQLRAVVLGLYGDLIDRFELSDEETGYFVDLLVDGMTAQQQLGLDLLAARTAEERSAIRKRIAELEESQLENVRVFLDDAQDFAEYERFVERLPERQQLTGLRDAMSGAGLEFTPSQEAAVVEAMYQIRRADPSGGPPAGVTGPEAVAQFEQWWQRRHEATLAALRPVLTARQLEVLAEYDRQLREMQLSGIRMAGELFDESSH